MAKTLAVPYYYQRDAQWATLCDPPISFSDQGCAVCCVAVITQYIDHARQGSIYKNQYRSELEQCIHSIYI